MRVFISTYDGLETPEGAAFAMALIRLGCEVDSSPRSPESGLDDERWNGWYTGAMVATIQRADCFVALLPVTSIYDGSSWMLSEFDEAFRQSRQRGSPTLFIYQLDSETLPVGFGTYVSASRRLPTDPDRAARMVASSA